MKNARRKSSRKGRSQSISPMIRPPSYKGGLNMAPYFIPTIWLNALNAVDVLEHNIYRNMKEGRLAGKGGNFAFASDHFKTHLRVIENVQLCRTITEQGFARLFPREAAIYRAARKKGRRRVGPVKIRSPSPKR